MLCPSDSRHSMSTTRGPRDMISLVIPRLGDNICLLKIYWIHPVWDRILLNIRFLVNVHHMRSKICVDISLKKLDLLLYTPLYCLS
jgi:hypothetical protein